MEAIRSLPCTGNEKKSVYIVFSSTSSKMGGLIRAVTKYKYNHVSLSLDRDMHKMYSFARYNYNAPLLGGFVEESALRYTNCATPADVVVYEIPLEPHVYDSLVAEINAVISHSEKYIYNTFSAILAPAHKSCSMKNAYTCVEFVAMLLERCGVMSANKEYVSIATLRDRLKSYELYEGNCLGFARCAGWGGDNYYVKKNQLRAVCGTLRQFCRLFFRMYERRVRV